MILVILKTTHNYSQLENDLTLIFSKLTIDINRGVNCGTSFDINYKKGGQS